MKGRIYYSEDLNGGRALRIRQLVPAPAGLVAVYRDESRWRYRDEGRWRGQRVVAVALVDEWYAEKDGQWQPNYQHMSYVVDNGEGLGLELANYRDSTWVDRPRFVCPEAEAAGRVAAVDASGIYEGP